MALNEQERERLLDVFGEFIYVADFHTYELLYMNEHSLKFLNLTHESYKHKKCYELIQGTDSPCSFCTNKYLSYDQVYTWEYKNPYLGRHFSIHDKLIDWDGRRARIELSFDITEIKEEVQTLESKMASMLESIPGGICQLADDGLLTVLWHNDAFLKILGYTREEFKAELNDTAGYIVPEDVAIAAAMLEKAKQTRRTQLFEMRANRRDGEVLTLLTSASYSPSAVGASCPVYYSVIVDITEYKRLLERNEREVKDALIAKAQAASQSKSRFLTRMSHELRTPLNVVMGMNRLAMRGRDDENVLRHCHAKIESAARYLLSLINDVLDFSRIESGKLQLSMQNFSLPSFLFDLYDLFSDTAAQKPLAFSLNVEPFEEEQFIGDTLHLKQILVNLLSNAFKFTDAHGRIDLAVRKLAGRGRTNVLEFTVTDTGIGISPKDLSRVFNVFEQESSELANQYGGSGLGLSISKSLAELMGGTITARSEKGEGSSFTVVIPLDAVPEQSVSDGACPVFSRVLVADTRKDGDTAIRMLHTAGIETAFAADGAETIRLLDAGAADGTPFDAVLLAASLPGADTVLEHIRNRPELESLRLALTGTQLPDPVSQTAGLSGFIRKPFFRSVLFRGLLELRGDAAKEPGPGKHLDFTGKRLLLVEDNALNMEIASEQLKEYGFSIEPAHNGKEAVERFAASEPYYFDAVLMDILMPVMDGLEATREIRRLGREDARTVPIIALSANAFEEDRQKSLDSGMTAHASKPLEIGALCKLLGTCLDAQSATGTV